MRSARVLAGPDRGRDADPVGHTLRSRVYDPRISIAADAWSSRNLALSKSGDHLPG
jgi:hypothetical protein